MIKNLEAMWSFSDVRIHRLHSAHVVGDQNFRRDHQLIKRGYIWFVFTGTVLGLQIFDIINFYTVFRIIYETFVGWISFMLCSLYSFISLVFMYFFPREISIAVSSFRVLSYFLFSSQTYGSTIIIIITTSILFSFSLCVSLTFRFLRLQFCTYSFFCCRKSEKKRNWFNYAQTYRCLIGSRTSNTFERTFGFTKHVA